MNLMSEEINNYIDCLKGSFRNYAVDQKNYFHWIKQIENYINDLESKVEDLTADKEHLEEELKDLRQDLEDNYRPIPISEQVGISDRDFI